MAAAPVNLEEVSVTHKAYCTMCMCVFFSLTFSMSVQGWKEVEAGCLKLATIIDEGMKESFPIAESSKHYT